MNVTNDHLPANIVITRRHIRLSKIIGQNASIIPRFAPTNVQLMKLIVDVISKRNVFWKKFLASFVFAGCRKIVEQKSMKNHLEESKDEHLEMTAVKCKTVGAELNYLKLVIAKISPKPIFNQPPDINMTDFEGCKKNVVNAGIVRLFTPTLVATRWAFVFMPMDGPVVKVLMLVWLST